MEGLDLEKLKKDLAGKDAETVIQTAVDLLGPSLCASTSFGAESAVLLHLVTRVWPEIPVLFTDTGFHFPETLAHLENLKRRLNLNLRILEPEIPHEEFLRTHGELYRRDPDRCCALNKIAPFKKALVEYRGWISGIRRDQSPTRRNASVVERTAEGVVKFNPLLDWNGKRLWEYAKRHDLPYHPLWEKGYLSIGCSPETCTRPVGAGEDPRAGRWAEFSKTECGIHVDAREDSSPENASQS